MKKRERTMEREVRYDWIWRPRLMSCRRTTLSLPPLKEITISETLRYINISINQIRSPKKRREAGRKEEASKDPGQRKQKEKLKYKSVLEIL